MDRTKQSRGPTDADSSDDLIAELARLVGQEARAPAGNEASDRREPSLEPSVPIENDRYDDADFSAMSGDFADDASVSPEPRQYTASTPSRPTAYASERQEPGFTTAHSVATPAPAPKSAFDFDFGFGTAPEPTASAPKTSGSADPIADLIASADEEAFAAAVDSDVEDVEETYDAAPEPTYSQSYTPVAPAPEPPQPPQQRDPLSDIEELIGEAGRSGSEGGPMGSRRVRSAFLTDAEQRDADFAADSAEAAIAAATAASVSRAAEPRDPAPQRYDDEPSFDDAEAQYERYDDVEQDMRVVPETIVGQEQARDEAVYDDEEEYAPPPVRRRGGGLKAIVLPAALGMLILAVGGGVYWTMFMGSGDPGEAPILAADGEPVKTEPEVTNTTSTASQSVVFGEIDGSGALESSETLVSRDQTDGVTGDAVSGVIASDDSDGGLANRRVRTVTVRPDGTIVSGEDVAAGSNVLPVDRPDVPDVPNSTLTTDPIGEAIAAAMGDAPASEAPVTNTEPVPSSGPTDTAPVMATDGLTPSLPDTTTPAASDGEIPRPVPRPSGLTLSSTPPAQTTAPATTEAVSAQSVQPMSALAATTPPPTQSAPSPQQETAAAASASAQTAAVPSAPVGAWVQLSSQRSQEVAQQSMSELQTRYGSLFGGAQPEVSQVDLAERGIYYRVRLPQPSVSAANSVCQSIQAQGGDCFVLSN